MSFVTELVIKQPPSNFLQWLECFEILGSRSVSNEDIKILRNGSCSDIGSSIDYLEKELIKTVNKMMDLCIRDFNREINMYLSFDENESYFEAYRRLARRLDNCLFFTDLDFLGESFRKELEQSVNKEINKFWLISTKILHDQCIDHYDKNLEDQSYFIKRLRSVKNNT